MSWLDGIDGPAERSKLAKQAEEFRKAKISEMWRRYDPLVRRLLADLGAKYPPWSARNPKITVREYYWSVSDPTSGQSWGVHLDFEGDILVMRGDGSGGWLGSGKIIESDFNEPAIINLLKGMYAMGPREPKYE